MAKRTWQINQQENMDKSMAAAESGQIKVSESVAKLLASSASVVPPKVIPAKEPTAQNTSVADKKRLPKLTISYYDKKGDLVLKEYTCATLDMTENTETSLTGNPTTRRDIVNLSIEAQVVAIS